MHIKIKTGSGAETVPEIHLKNITRTAIKLDQLFKNKKNPAFLYHLPSLLDVR
jgi:hypothetical protein